MLGLTKKHPVNPIEEQYSQLKLAAKKAYNAGDLDQYRKIMTQLNRVLVKMFSSDSHSANTRFQV